MKKYGFFKKLISLGMIFSLTFTGLSGCGQKKTGLVNVSYDATREFYKEYNRLFEDYWYGRTGEKVEVIQSHGGSGKQALEVANGLGADVVTLALEGDVLIAWENEAFFALQEYPGEYEIVVPSASVLCQPTVAKVDEVTQMNGTEELADAYLSFLYTDDAQRLEAQNFYRPVNKDIQNEYESSSDSRNIKEIPSDGKWIVKDIDMADIGYFGGWEAATQKFFSDGGIFDKIYD